MFHIDFAEQFNEVLLDRKRKVSKYTLENVCKIYKKEKTCRYLGLSSIGYVCVKNSLIEDKLDFLVKNDEISAKGDNCDGKLKK